MRDLILWWENELTCDDRDRLFKAINYDGWEGTTEERHAKLKEMHEFAISELNEGVGK